MAWNKPGGTHASQLARSEESQADSREAGLDQVQGQEAGAPTTTRKFLVLVPVILVLFFGALDALPTASSPPFLLGFPPSTTEAPG